MTATEKTLPAMPLPSDSLWARLRATPLTEALRGRLTGSLDFRRVIAAANLREPLPGLIYKTVRKTRLWRTERVDVARELADHFRDGSDAGRTPEELLKSFGDPRQAARLIRRAKLRSRPLAWRIYRRALQAAGVLLAVGIASYLVLLIRYVSGRPTISRNYVAELNAAAKAVPEADRAWPLYRKALLRMTPLPRLVAPPGKVLSWEDRQFFVDYEKPSDKHWNMVAAWLAENRSELPVIRQAATRPRLGFVRGDPADIPWLEKAKYDPNRVDPNENDWLLTLMQPLLSDGGMRKIVSLLSVDVHRAVAENDPAAFVQDVEAIVGAASHIRDDAPFALTDSMSFGVFGDALAKVNETLAQNPGLLSDAGLKQLAHSIAGYAGGGTIHYRLAAEKLELLDIVQRIYTDDGHGDGRLTLGDGNPGFFLHNYNYGKLGDFSLGPAVCTLVPSRRATTELTEELFDRAEAEARPPLWEWTPSTVEAQIMRWQQSPVDRIRYALIILFCENLQRDAFYGEHITQQRDATLVALALELYHRRHGSWPEKLSALVPDLLPAVPPDRFTGGPMLYRIVDGRPLLYSAGPDRKDDGGRSVADIAEIKFYPPPGSGDANANAPPDGDWILWPPQEERKK